ncbi:hypothetical protein Sru01_47860 [Sphaerisporangium rufum]|uniref:PPIase cyclophilin-type domain-containing protein n=1 Tax=Sphaerisporangium rufum TaxID=1381558 RepID=A0A919R5C4_9ACTN|nr:peptidylprolyl isomerase [Sphaerisporangium rufum]GII79804.1 hypothetical protein Sru01_47860 [Sphaerisporangium rufum]
MNIEESLRDAMSAEVAEVRAPAGLGSAVRAAHRRRTVRARTAGAGVLTAVVAAGFPISTTLQRGGPDEPAVMAGPATTATTATTGATGPAAVPPPVPAVTCRYRRDDGGRVKKVGLPPARPDGRPGTMKIVTNRGTIVIELAAAQAPCTVNSFRFLAAEHYFDGTRCHRLATPEATGLGMLQCGDPLAKGDGRSAADGTGGPGYLFDDENLGGMRYTRGTVAMAQGPEQANSNGSQFWISFADDNDQLAAGGAAYTPFGKVVRGMDVVDRIARGGFIPFRGDPMADARGEGSNAPRRPVVIERLTVS